jgi:transposase
MWLSKAKKYFPNSNNIFIRWFDNGTTTDAVEVPISELILSIRSSI